MKYAPIWLLLTVTGTGCAYDEKAQEAQQARLSEIEQRIDSLDTSVQQSQAEMTALGESQGAASQTLDNSLQQLSSSLEVLPFTLAELCKPPDPQTAAPICEPREPLRTVVTHSDKLLLGELEHVWIEPLRASLVARMDTGATSSSLHADNLKTFERDGEDWVRFELLLKEQPVELERRIIRHARVIQQADPSGSRRPVVEMRIRIGTVDEVFEFTLADRAHLENEMILGRNFLTDIALVDVGRRFIQPVYEPDSQ